MRRKWLKRAVAFVIVSVVVLAGLLAVLRVSQAGEAVKEPSTKQQGEWSNGTSYSCRRVFLVHAVGF